MTRTAGFMVAVLLMSYALSAPAQARSRGFMSSHRMVKLVHGADAPCPPGTEGIKHVVALDVEVGADGTVQDVARMNAESSPLDDAAIAAAKQSTFSPAMENGVAAPMRKDVFVVFRGDGQPGQIKDKADQAPIARVSSEAEFSDEARRQRYQGEVMLRMLVTETGEPSGIQIVKHLPAGLDEESVKAARKYRFSPAEIDGQAVPVHVMIAINFRL